MHNAQCRVSKTVRDKINLVLVMNRVIQIETTDLNRQLGISKRTKIFFLTGTGKVVLVLKQVQRR
jgi:hypothetical protein